MQRFLVNITQSKAPPMVFLRYLLLGAIMFMGVARLRITLLVLLSPDNYQSRDMLQLYLMSKALISGQHPYLPLSVLAEKFIGTFPYFPHPAPYPPFTAILFIPLTWLSINASILTWYLFELLILAAIACLLVVLWKNQLKAFPAILLFFGLLAWHPVMAALEVGQFSILLTMLVLAAILAMQRNRKILAGVLIGFSAAIKLVTWPILLYMLLKKEWKAARAGILTVLGLNLAAMLMMGIRPFLDYYLSVSSQVIDIYNNFWANFSLFTVGYRLFEGTDSAIFASTYHAPPLVSLPSLAPWLAFGSVVLYLLFTMSWAIRTTSLESAFALLNVLMVAISPIVWDHYYVMISISLVVLLRNLARHSFPAHQTLSYFLVFLLLFFLNDRIFTFVTIMNGGQTAIEANGNMISFVSSLLFFLPLLELIAISLLLTRSISIETQIEPVTAVSTSP